MKGLMRQILAIIEEVECEIRVDLGLEQTTELQTIETLEVMNESPEIEKPEEWEEVKAFEKVLDEICARYESEETEDWDGTPSEALEKILTIL